MFAQSIAAVALLAGAASAKTCLNMTIPVTISSRNGVFGGIATPTDNLGATLFALNSTRQGANGTALALTGYATVSGTYNISAEYCMPSNTTTTSSNATTTNSTMPNLQILTHGIGFDKTYWDYSFNNFNYSYVNNALAAGYHTFAYDRLGIGNSSHGEPKNEIQSFLEIQALAAVTNMLRNGTVPQIKTRFSKLIHVGHSFGSAQTYALTAMYPNISDGIVLTGFSMNGSFVSDFVAGNDFQQAYLNQPLRFGTQAILGAASYLTQYLGLADLLAPIDFTTLFQQPYVPGYLIQSNAGATNYLFLYNGNFDPAILAYAEKTKQPVTVGEALTLTSLPMTSTFSKPVLVFTAQYDVPYCGGNCLATGNPMVPSIPSQVSKNIPGAAPFASYIQPTTGHGLQLHYNATAGNQYINNFLKSHGL